MHKTLALAMFAVSAAENIAEVMTCVQSKCPLDENSLAPSTMCVLENCGLKVIECEFDSKCRHTLACTEGCTKPLAHTEDGKDFAKVAACIGQNCHTFPPSDICLLENCKMPLFDCGIDSKCRNALECSSKCGEGSAEELDVEAVSTLEVLQAQETTGDTKDLLTCVSKFCPVDEATLSPSKTCVLEHCGVAAAQCMFSSECRHLLDCEQGCVKDIVGTDDGKDFAAVSKCLGQYCPEFPPSATCVLENCKMPIASCGIGSKCRAALECSSGCVPKKAALEINV